MLSAVRRCSGKSFHDFVAAMLKARFPNFKRVRCLCTVGQVVHTLPKGETVRGVTSLADEIYVLRQKARDQVEVYDIITYRLLRCLTVPNTIGFVDMTSGGHNRCVYIANGNDRCIYGLDVQGAGKWWCVNDKPSGLSVNAAHNVLVTCHEVREIKEFSSHGDLLRELTLPDDFINPWHVIQLTTGQFIVCHGFTGDTVHRVCKISRDGRNIVHAHGGQQDSDIGQFSHPRHLAVDNTGFVFVADVFNQRVKLLSPTLDYVRQVVAPDDLKSLPTRLYLDTQRRRLYVADNEFEDNTWTLGRVVVVSV